MTMHRVAILSGVPAPYREPVFAGLAKRPGIDLKVFYCTPNHDDLAWSDSRSRNDYCHEFLPNWTPPHYRRLQLLGYSNLAVIQRLRGFRPDYVIVYGHSHLTHWLAYAYCRLTRTPFAMRCDANVHFDTIATWTNRVRYRVLRWLVNHCSGVLAIGQANREYWRRYGAGEKKIFFAPYAIDNQRVAELTSNRPPAPAGELRFGYTGRLVQLKNVELLVRAFNEVATDERARLNIIGDGPERQKLQSLQSASASQRTQWLGRQNYEDTLRGYGLSDVFVFPSGADRWGLVVNEAMAAGLPVIAYERVGATVDLIDEGQTGWRLKELSVTAIANVLRQCLADPLATRAMGTNALRKVADWNYQRAVDGFVEAIEAGVWPREPSQRPSITLTQRG